MRDLTLRLKVIVQPSIPIMFDIISVVLEEFSNMVYACEVTLFGWKLIALVGIFFP